MSAKAESVELAAGSYGHRVGAAPTLGQVHAVAVSPCTQLTTLDDVVVATFMHLLELDRQLWDPPHQRHTRREGSAWCSGLHTELNPPSPLRNAVGGPRRLGPRKRRGP
jgi:hypothetical protein